MTYNKILKTTLVVFNLYADEGFKTYYILLA